jgi:hypothetical protein
MNIRVLPAVTPIALTIAIKLRSRFGLKVATTRNGAYGIGINNIILVRKLTTNTCKYPKLESIRD